MTLLKKKRVQRVNPTFSAAFYFVIFTDPHVGSTEAGKLSRTLSTLMGLVR